MTHTYNNRHYSNHIKKEHQRSIKYKMQNKRSELTVKLKMFLQRDFITNSACSIRVLDNVKTLYLKLLKSNKVGVAEYLKSCHLDLLLSTFYAK